MRRRLAFAVAALVVGVLVVVALVSGPTAAQESGEPSVSLDTRSGRFGEPLGVRGTGWTPNSTVFVELCGNEARNGTPDCDQENARLVGVGSSGSFAVPILVGQPPSPCPCVVQVSSQGSPAVATAPVEVPEAAFAELDEQTVDPRPTRQLALRGRIEGSGPWTAWFGASPQRTVVISVENVGDVAVNDPVLSLAVGRGDDPTGFLESVEIGRLAPGETRQLEVPMELGALAFGRYTVTGEIAALDQPASFSAQTSSYPWALILIPLAVVVQFVLLRVRNRVRNRLHRVPTPEEELEGELTPALAPAVAGALPAATGPSTEADDARVDSAQAAAEDEVTEPSERVLVGALAGAATAGSAVSGDESTTVGPAPPSGGVEGSAVGGDESTTVGPAPPSGGVEGSAESATSSENDSATAGPGGAPSVIRDAEVVDDEVSDAVTAAGPPPTAAGPLDEPELEDLLVEALIAEIARAVEQLGDQRLTRPEAERLAEQVASEVATSMAGRTNLSPNELDDLTRELSGELADSLVGWGPKGAAQGPPGEAAVEQDEAVPTTGRRGWFRRGRSRGRP